MSAGHRLVAGADFRRVMQSGRPSAADGVVMYHEPRIGEPRVGFVVSRRIGTAVARNRTKRVLREAARLELLPRLTSADVVIIATRPTVRLAHARRALETCAERAGLLAPRPTKDRQ